MGELYKIQQELDDNMRALCSSILSKMPKTLKDAAKCNDTLRTFIYMSIAMSVSRGFLKILSEKNEKTE